jgi:glycerophosphoryl diester phosphodiesterase
MKVTVKPGLWMIALALLALGGVFYLGRITGEQLQSGQGKNSTETASKQDNDGAVAVNQRDVAAFFDCVRGQGVLLGAHRGGPADGLPENAIETFVETMRYTPLLEVDVVQSRDGVLFLMHDSSLDRTSTGTGPVLETDWAQISQAFLKDNNGTVTAFRAPTLEQALEWAKQSGAILQLDKKRSTSFADLINAVRAKDMLTRVIFITYSLEDAVLVHQLAPEAAMTVSIEGEADLARLQAEGVDLTKVFAWTGTRSPNPGLWQLLNTRGVESFFGTLGRPADRLDTRYWEDGNPSEYQDLVASGLQVIATDEVRRVANALTADDKALAACR